MVMSIINSVFRPTDKCQLINENQHFCVYFMDIVFAVVILLLLIPQVFVVSVLYKLQAIHLLIVIDVLLPTKPYIIISTVYNVH